MRSFKDLTCKEINALNLNNENVSFEDWYEALKCYTEGLGEDWDRSLVEDCGIKCWEQAYNDGLEIQEAFMEGFCE